jgi:hypothetical protein
MGKGEGMKAATKECSLGDDGPEGRPEQGQTQMSLGGCRGTDEPAGVQPGSGGFDCPLSCGPCRAILFSPHCGCSGYYGLIIT